MARGGEEDRASGRTRCGSASTPGRRDPKPPRCRGGSAAAAKTPCTRLSIGPHNPATPACLRRGPARPIVVVGPAIDAASRSARSSVIECSAQRSIGLRPESWLVLGQRLTQMLGLHDGDGIPLADQGCVWMRKNDDRGSRNRTQARGPVLQGPSQAGDFTAGVGDRIPERFLHKEAQGLAQSDLLVPPTILELEVPFLRSSLEDDQTGGREQ